MVWAQKGVRHEACAQVTHLPAGPNKGSDTNGNQSLKITERKWTKTFWNKSVEGKTVIPDFLPSLEISDKSFQVASGNFHPLVPTGEASRS